MPFTEQRRRVPRVRQPVGDRLWHVRRRPRRHPCAHLTFPTSKAFEAERKRAYRGFTTVIERAKDAGKLRADLSPEDLPILLMANAGVISATRDSAPHTWRRLLGYFLQACAADSAQPLPDPLG